MNFKINQNMVNRNPSGLADFIQNLSGGYFLGIIQWLSFGPVNYFSFNGFNCFPIVPQLDLPSLCRAGFKNQIFPFLIRLNCNLRRNNRSYFMGGDGLGVSQRNYLLEKGLREM